MNQPAVVVGARFKNKKELKLACQTLSTSGMNFEYTVVKSDKSRFRIKCLAQGCLWSLFAIKVVDEAEDPFFEIRTMNNEHTCAGIQHLGHRQATATFLGAQIQAKLRDQPNYRPKDIQDDIRRQFGLHINYMTANRAKEQGLVEINGTAEDSYHKMPEYCEDLNRNNPGSTIVLERSTEEAGISRFKRVFICFGASTMGFQFCRPILGLDGTHLKSKYRGMHFFLRN